MTAYAGLAVDDGASVGLSAQGLHPRPSQAVAGAQPLPGSLQPQWNIRQQDSSVEVVCMYEGKVWGGRVFLHARHFGVASVSNSVTIIILL